MLRHSTCKHHNQRRPHRHSRSSNPHPRRRKTIRRKYVEGSVAGVRQAFASLPSFLGTVVERRRMEQPIIRLFFSCFPSLFSSCFARSSGLNERICVDFLFIVQPPSCLSCVPFLPRLSLALSFSFHFVSSAILMMLMLMSARARVCVCVSVCMTDAVSLSLSFVFVLGCRCCCCHRSDGLQLLFFPHHPFSSLGRARQPVVCFFLLLLLLLLLLFFFFFFLCLFVRMRVKTNAVCVVR